ncbi:alpha/beta hydrolase [Methylobacterium sp. WL8]|uniref:alpha/beta fold hydrolase n=1 Tax=Methylobacterium sp. WL8 TaxID=2603899 RepID=UPI0011CA0502|nr:alpha/beta hydrolase [Methylobacterium sp. WL8]TXM99715.1 alpha/beta hydrolase [Methylobacterium sp. WL122]TXN82857.1 alpha/beta hydrolase [Methylobacterium sp. WL8]
MPTIRHDTLPLNGLDLHVAQVGSGPPLLLLHGWPEFWLTWEPVMTRLSERFTCIAPDLRGFGRTGKPDAGPNDKVGPKAHVQDMLALLDALGLDRVGVVSHDVGAYVAQGLAHAAPERLEGLFFFDCPYGGIGPRLGAPENLREIWYQSFHLMPYAADLVGSSREACKTYVGGILRHWSGPNPHAFDDVIEDFVDNFLRPGNLQGGFDWYLSQNAGRIAMIRGEAPVPKPIAVPTCIRWGDSSPLFPYAWTDRLPEYFSNLDLAPFPGAAHFPHRENPDAAAAEIARFFSR